MESSGGCRVHLLKFHPSMELYSNTRRRVANPDGLKKKGSGTKYGPIHVEKQDQNPELPLAIILGWFAAKKRHLMKFIGVYLELGFDVLLISLPASGLAHPVHNLTVCS